MLVHNNFFPIISETETHQTSFRGISTNPK